VILGHKGAGALLRLSHDAVFLLFFIEEPFQAQIVTYDLEVPGSLLAMLFSLANSEKLSANS
jgi:hypothetical protein